MEELIQKLLDAYHTLGVRADSPLSEVARVYRKLAKRYHPDSNPDDPASSQEMMTKINAAYTTIKEYGELGLAVMEKGAEWRDEPRGDHTLWAWIERFEKERREEEEQRKREAERLRREREFYNRFWEKVAQEQMWEKEDRKMYGTILRYTQTLLSFFYKMNFHNVHMRGRPSVQGDFEGFVKIYRQWLRRISALKKTGKSVLYKRKSSRAYEFLRSFINDSLNPEFLGAERRASALDVFERAARFSHDFLRAYFSPDGIEGGEALELFKKSLGFYEAFVKAFPESPLVECAHGKVEVLERMYRAFLRDE